MLKITDLKIDPNSLGDVFLLAEISPSYDYRTGRGQPTSMVINTR